MERLPHDELPAPPHGRSGWPWRNEASTPLAPAHAAIEWPRISIVTVSYNQGHFLEETLRSVLLQGYPNLEYIIMDGGSSDNSVELLQKYSPWLDYWTSGPDQGQSDAINNGFARSSGDILCWLNSDDFLAPDALFKAARALLDNPAAGAVVGVGHKIDAKRRTIYSPLPSEVTTESLFSWCNGQNFMQPACFFTRKAWQTSGPLRLDLDYCMDLALWFTMAKDHQFVILNETLAFIHTHRDAKTVKDRPLMFGEIALLMATQPGGWTPGKRLLVKTMQQSVRNHRAASVTQKLRAIRKRAESLLRWRRAIA